MCQVDAESPQPAHVAAVIDKGPLHDDYYYLTSMVKVHIPASFARSLLFTDGTAIRTAFITGGTCGDARSVATGVPRPLLDGGEGGSGLCGLAKAGDVATRLCGDNCLTCGGSADITRGECNEPAGD